MATQVQPNVFTEVELDEAQAAYLAGLIDGEGTIGLWGIKPSARRRAVLVPHLEIGNTNRDLIDWLVRITQNGRIVLNREIEGCKRCYKWQLAPRQVALILPQVLPYLIAKRRQGEVVARFLELQAQGRQEGGRGVLDRDWPEVEALYREIRTLNRRGDHEPAPIDLTPGERRKRKHTCNVEGCEDRRYRSHTLCYRHWLQEREPILKTCEWCGNEMDAIMPHRRFCSPKCQWQSAYQRRKNE